MLEASLWLILFPFSLAFILGFLYYDLWKISNPPQQDAKATLDV